MKEHLRDRWMRMAFKDQMLNGPILQVVHMDQ